MLAKQVGGVNYLGEQKSRELLDLKTKWGFSDPRTTEEYKNCDICANDIFRESWQASGVERKAFPAPPAAKPEPAGSASADGQSMSQERLVQTITELVMKQLQAQG